MMSGIHFPIRITRCICGSVALLDLSMQEERHAQTQASRSKELTKGALIRQK